MELEYGNFSFLHFFVFSTLDAFPEKTYESPFQMIHVKQVLPSEYFFQRKVWIILISCPFF